MKSKRANCKALELDVYLPKPNARAAAQQPNCFEIIEMKDLQKMDPKLKDKMIVSVKRNLEENTKDKESEVFYVTSYPLPFIFELEKKAISGNVEKQALMKAITYISQLQRIRIVQTLIERSPCLNFGKDNHAYHDLIGFLHVEFSVPIINQPLWKKKFMAKFKPQEQGFCHSLISIEDIESMGNRRQADYIFQGTCCLASFKFIMNGVTSAYSCLMWCKEKRTHSPSVFSCTLNLTVSIQVTMYFTLLNSQTETNPQIDGKQNITMTLTKIEITVPTKANHHHHQQLKFNVKEEFQSIIKRAKLQESEDNYRFNYPNIHDLPRLPARANPVLTFNRYVEKKRRTEFTQGQQSPKVSAALAAQAKNIQGKPTDSCFRTPQVDSQGTPLHQTLIAQSSHPASPPRQLDETFESTSQMDFLTVETILQATKDRDSCLALQNVVRNLDKETHNEIISVFFQLIRPRILEVASGTYGNFLVQILISKLTSDHRKVILTQSAEEITLLSLDSTGIFCVQALFDSLETPEEYQLFFKIINNNLNTFVKDHNAGFVLKKVIQNSPLQYVKKFQTYIRPLFLHFACDKSGICVIKFIIGRYESDLANFESIAQDFMIFTKKGKSNSQFNFGLHHIIEVANARKWRMASINEIIREFYEADSKFKIRSKSILQTIKLTIWYHDTQFVEDFVRPAIYARLSKPFSQNEIDVICEASQRWPEYSELLDKKILDRASTSHE